MARKSPRVPMMILIAPRVIIVIGRRRMFKIGLKKISKIGKITKFQKKKKKMKTIYF